MSELNGWSIIARDILLRRSEKNETILEDPYPPLRQSEASLSSNAVVHMPLELNNAPKIVRLVHQSIEGSIQLAPGGGGCASVVPGMTNPGGNWKLFGIPGNWKPKPGTAGATPMLVLSRLSLRSG